jgi:hypothetical protein
VRSFQHIAAKQSEDHRILDTKSGDAAYQSFEFAVLLDRGAAKLSLILRHGAHVSRKLTVSTRVDFTLTAEVGSVLVTNSDDDGGAQ